MVDRAAERDGKLARQALRRIRHPWRVLVFGAITLSLISAAFVAGGYVRSPKDDALTAARQSIPVTVMVESRVVAAGFSIPGTLMAATTSPILIEEASREGTAAERPKGDIADSADSEHSASHGERVMVTRSIQKPGGQLAVGDLIAEVSGRPLFAISPEVPLFRDLTVGDTGADVEALQRMLRTLDYFGVPENGILDQGTLAAMSRLYRSAKYELPIVRAGVPGIAWREFAPVPRTPVAVASVASVGTVLSAEVPVLSVVTSDPAIKVRLTGSQKDLISIGGSVDIQTRGGPAMSATIVDIGPLTTDESSGISGYDALVAIPQRLEGIDASEVIRVSATVGADPAPAVPITAIRHDSQGPYIVVARDREHVNTQTAESTRRLPVTVVAQADGWASISATAEIAIGTEVEVAP